MKNHWLWIIGCGLPILLILILPIIGIRSNVGILLYVFLCFVFSVIIMQSIHQTETNDKQKEKISVDSKENN